MDLIYFPFVIFSIFFIYLSFHRPGLAILLFFSTKFGLDWAAQLTSISNYFQFISAVIVLFGFGIIFIRSSMREISKNLKVFIIILLIFNLLSGIWGIINSHFLFFELVHSPIRLVHVMTWMGRVVAIVLPFLVGMTIRSSELSISRILAAIVIGTIPICLNGIWEVIVLLSQQTPSLGFNWYSNWRISGGLFGPGTLGFTMLIGICCGYYLFFSNLISKKLYNYLLILYLILSYVVLTCTITRTTWISLIFFFLFVHFFNRSLLHWRTASVFIILLLNPIMWSRLQKEIDYLKIQSQSLKADYEVNKLGSGRIWLWKDAFRHFTILDPISQIIGSGGYFGSHNQYIAWLLRNGIAGLTIWLLFLFILIYYIYKSTWIHKNFMYALFIMVVLVTNLFSQPWDNFNFSLIFWFLIGSSMNDSFSLNKV